MTTIIRAPQRAPTTFERFADAFTQAANNPVQQGVEAYKKEKEYAPQQDYYSKLTGGGTLSKDPNIARVELLQAMKNQQKNKEIDAKRIDYMKAKDILMKNGATEDEADLYAAASVGGQTHIIKDFVEQKRRKSKLQKNYPQLDIGERGEQEAGNEFPEEAGEAKPQLSNKQIINKDLKKHLDEQDEGLTPPERIARGNQRFTTNVPIYDESSKKLRSLQSEERRIDELSALAATDKLPSGLERINIDTDGNLRIPSGSSVEAERYVKLLNEFSENAKDSYGARVTNFDLAQFFRRYPTLLNSAEGRRQILQHMKIVNQINASYYKNLKGVFDSVGGVRNVDPDTAIHYAERLSQKKADKLTLKLGEIGKPTAEPGKKLPGLPAASEENKGRPIRNKRTGEIFVSDGQNWIPQSQAQGQ